ncbi:hypothetical protein Hanom_Chr10g00952761 [Helianthus anomalus]
MRLVWGIFKCETGNIQWRIVEIITDQFPLKNNNMKPPVKDINASVLILFLYYFLLFTLTVFLCFKVEPVSSFPWLLWAVSVKAQQGSFCCVGEGPIGFRVLYIQLLCSWFMHQTIIVPFIISSSFIFTLCISFSLASYS